MLSPVVDLTGSSPQPEADAQLLDYAINKLKASHAHAILRYICKAMPDAADSVRELLLVSEKGARYRNEDARERRVSDDEDDEEEDDSNDEDTSAGSELSEESTKSTPEKSKNSSVTSIVNSKKRTRYAICENCKEEFDVTDNRNRECRWHDHFMEVERDWWVDHDENCHGPINTDKNREEFPEGFRYDCCDQDGTAEGCNRGNHVEEENTTKRIRY